MKEIYITNEEYPNYFSNLEGLRSRIALELPFGSATRILDLATGYGYFAIEIARLWNEVKIVGIDISETDVGKSREKITRSGFTDQIEVMRMDATSMGFPNSSFDMVTNFLGLEDIHMTRGSEGVEKTFREVARVLKPRGYFCFTAIPPEEAETEAQRIEVEVFSWLCGATWLLSGNYDKMLVDNGLKLVSRKAFSTGKKLNTDQAKEEIRFACENVPKIYGVRTATFEEAWGRFGSLLEKHGMGHYSRVVLFIAQKMP